MIVDLDMRIWARTEDLGEGISSAVRRSGAARWVRPDASPDGLLAALQTVDCGLVLGFRSDLLRGAVPEAAIRRLLDFAATHAPGRLLYARAVDPMAADAAAEVESARAAGACAIWLDPALQGFHPSDTRAMRVFDRAEAMQLPVFVGWSGPLPSAARLEFGRPYLLDEVARAFPRLSIVLAGCGHPFTQEALALVAKHDRVFTTLAGVASRPWELLQVLQQSRDMGVDAKLLFASGFPFDTAARAIEAIYSVNTAVHSTHLPHVARSVLREIVERDAVSLLGLGVPPTPRDRLAPRPLAARLDFDGATAGDQRPREGVQP
jgi:predicted TIM-barrel fold metal-dependent hydrolase